MSCGTMDLGRRTGHRFVAFRKGAAAEMRKLAIQECWAKANLQNEANLAR